MKQQTYLVEMTVTGIILGVRAIQSKQGQKAQLRSVFAFGILFLIVAAVGEASSAIATGFASLLLVAVLFSPKTDLSNLLQLPNRFIGGAT